jgi:hypothetical protein
VSSQPPALRSLLQPGGSSDVDWRGIHACAFYELGRSRDDDAGRFFLFLSTSMKELLMHRSLLPGLCLGLALFAQGVHATTDKPNILVIWGG